MTLPDWTKFLRWKSRPADDEMARKRRDVERNRQAYELVGTAVFRDTFHEELDELVDRWLVEKDPLAASRLHVQAQELMALVQRLQARAQRHHESVYGQQRKTSV